ncbi:kinase-like protein [Gymnopus androsaceus JB14]|uniref:Kinase-like protein n=1 Tax=Gymnopus androsaceus JB14 TaxID=1447944 RepID=A0A6A4HZI1_9AGAR|nr:kinase-like protein [Gymnopus androsaceus JB14]
MNYQSSEPAQPTEEPEVETQPVDSQSLSQNPELLRPLWEVEEHVWAYLLPMSKDIKQIDFLKPQTTYRIGRNETWNKIVFPGYKISNKHAEITWDGMSSRESIITLKDLSSNGTFVNGVKLGRGHSRILTDGAEVAFGSTSSSPTNPFEDYRFIFRHTASGRNAETGFYSLYDIGYQLGRGSFASVVQCMDRATGIFWAAKIFSNTIGIGGSGTLASKTDKMVSREIQILQKLSHPNICFLKDTFILEEGKLILVLELIQGGDLLEYILSNAGTSEEMAQHITYQLCLALSYVHSLGIAHRDLKPENVLLTDEKPPNVKVADFGLAKAADSQTMLKTMCGTPAYLAPEVVHQTSDEGYDNLVDSWSVGVIVFSMLTNASPFVENDTITDVRLRIATRHVDWTILKEKTANPHIIDFVESLLATDPGTRMTLTGALDHPWLQDYVVKNGRDAKADRALGQMRGSIEPESSVSTPKAHNDEDSKPGSALFSRGFENLAINETPGAGPSNTNRGDPSDPVAPAAPATDGDAEMEDKTPPPSSQPRPLQAQNSRVLRRRRDVLDEALENDGETSVPRPSPDLLSQFDEKQKRAAAETESSQPQAGPSNQEKQRGKRMHDDLSAVPEEEMVNGSGGDASMNGDMDAAVQPTPAKRRRTPVPAARSAKKGKKEPVAEPRRSLRNKRT